MDEEKKLNDFTKTLMLFTAILFDVLSLVSFIPVIGWVLGWAVWLFAFLTFFTWYASHGISFSKPKNLGGFLGGSLIELIPYIDLLPGWTVTILYLNSIQNVVNKVVSEVPVANNVLKFTPKGRQISTNGDQNKLERAA